VISIENVIMNLLQRKKPKNEIWFVQKSECRTNLL